ncbi:MAG: hypothetical protein OXE54_01105 [Gammaproteobacteria bacterium]|nr:hypothetical protein [Gammaproteobacteria bacterium]
MSTVIQGQFDDLGLPKIDIGICKDVHGLPESQIRVSGIIDKGFSGFVQIPRTLATELRLTLRAWCVLPRRDFPAYLAGHGFLAHL